MTIRYLGSFLRQFRRQTYWPYVRVGIIAETEEYRFVLVIRRFVVVLAVRELDESKIVRHIADPIGGVARVQMESVMEGNENNGYFSFSNFPLGRNRK